MADAPKPSIAEKSFVVPGHYNVVYFNKPDNKSVLVHSYSSSFVHPGFQAIVCFDSQPVLPIHLGLPKMDTYDGKVFIQISTQDQPFISQSEVVSGQGMQINSTEYLILLQFICKEWPRLSSKLNYQFKTMRQGTEPVSISRHLVFYNHGSSFFQTNVSSRLVFKAWIQSDDSKCNIKCILEKKADHSDAIECIMLPMESLTALAQDDAGVKTMIAILASYKSRTQK